jgi:hypothetical protein
MDKKMGTNTLKVIRLSLVMALVIPGLSGLAQASSGTEGASFLDIPVGAGPASLGSAYTALANDAYAPTWNPGALGFVEDTEVAAQHLSYLESIHYEYLSFVHPLTPKEGGSKEHRAVGFSAQYLASGSIPGTDINGASTGDFSTHYGSYNVAYGQTFGEKLSMGLTGKWINAKIDDVSANAYAMDFGTLYRMSQKLSLAATLTNLGTKLKFIDEGDSLPLAFHVGGAYEMSSHFLFSAEGVYPKTGLGSFHVGGAWRPIESMSLRVGYKTDTLKGLNALAGFTAGIGLHVFGQEFAYAWAPYGELGNAQYFSLVGHFGGRDEAKRNLIQYQTIKKHRTVKNADATEPEYQQLMQILSDDGSHLASAPDSSAAAER